jgi:DNA-directed RNA polymerase specialized sigma24 family protein
VRRCSFATEEREDIESQLVLILLIRWPKFDSARASVQTFASRLMDRELTSILRYRLAHRRQPRDLPVPPAGPTASSIHQFRIDLNRAMAQLPEVVRETASALSCLSSVEAADAVGCSRQMISRRKHQIRGALVAAGINANYFLRGGTRQ